MPDWDSQGIFFSLTLSKLLRRWSLLKNIRNLVESFVGLHPVLFSMVPKILMALYQKDLLDEELQDVRVALISYCTWKKKLLLGYYRKSSTSRFKPTANHLFTLIGTLGIIVTLLSYESKRIIRRSINLGKSTGTWAGRNSILPVRLPPSPGRLPPLPPTPPVSNGHWRRHLPHRH